MEHQAKATGGQPRGKRFKRLVAAIAALLVMGLIGALIYDQRGQSQFDHALAEARADGQPLTLPDIERASRQCPEEQNGASIIVALASRLETIAKDEQVRVLPTFSDADKKLAEQPLGQPWPAAVDEQVAAQLARFLSELGQIDHLRRFERGRFPFPYTRNPATGLSWLSDAAFSMNRAIETAVRLKTLDVMWRSMHGETARLVEDVAVLLSFSRMLQDEPVLMDSLIGAAADAAAATALEEACAHNVLTVEQLSAVMELLSAADARNLLLAGSIGERALRLERANVSGLSASDAGRSAPIVSRVLWSVPGARGWMLRFQSATVGMQNRFVAAAMRPENTMIEYRRLVGAKPDLTERMNRLQAASYISDRAFELNASSKAVVRSALVALAAERYRLDKNTFPPTADELVPGYLGTVPRDPYDGRPLRYRLTEQGAVVYAIGENMIDDGGQVRPSADKRGPDTGFTLLEPRLRYRAPSSQPSTIPASEHRQ